MTSLYYDMVPKEPTENLRWRIRCRERALTDKRFRNALHQACMDDVCFWFAFATWGYDPRARFKIVPFIPYEHQVNVIRRMDEAIDTAQREERSLDVILDKARAQGGTFIYLWVDLRRWLRDPMFSAGYVTRNDKLVDSKTDSNTVLWKIQFALDRLPFWMVPKYERNLTQHSFLNQDNQALLVGYAAGQDVAAGGRATVFTVDEAGARDFVAGGKDEAVQESLQDVSNCLARGVKVVTHEGLVPIENVQLHHLVWDGTMWTAHEGCVYRGEQATIQSYGIELTPDHRVLTKDGWKHARDIGFDREDIHLPDGYREKWPHVAWQDSVAVSMQMREADCGFGKFAQPRAHEKLRLFEVREFQEANDDAWHAENANMERVGVHDSALHQSKKSKLFEIRRSRNQCVRTLDEVREFPGGYGRKTGQTEYRPRRQQRKLLSGELPLGDGFRTGQQQAKQLSDSDILWDSECCSDIADNRSKLLHGHGTHQERLDRGCSFASTQNLTSVYDLLNCGPRRAFTVIDDSGRPLLVHNCVRMVSARYVDQGVFHRACENPDTAKNGVHLVLDWKDHPQQSKHSYIVREGVSIAMKPEDQPAVNQYHKDNPDLRSRLEKKGFKFDNVVRSPWYDSRCLRPAATPRLIASQLDRNPRGAVGKVFSSDLLDRMKREHCKRPVWVGNPVFDSETCKLTGLIPRDDGLLKLWFRPGIDNSPPLGPFTAGADISSGGSGAYASNSVLTALDDRTGEQVLEYTVKGLEPRPFARRCVGICMWLRNALLGWEDSGVSGGYAKEIMEVLYYGNVFYRNVTQLGSQKKSRKPGWPCRDADKADMFEMMSLAMETGKFVPRSEEMVVELGEYEWDGAKIVHAPSKNRGASDTNHADRAIASAGAWLVFNTDVESDNVDTSDETGQTPEYGSFLWREQQERSNVNSGSPRYGLRDIIRR